MADRVGEQLGNYHLISLLGKGGFAEVYEAKHIHLGTMAAIKVLHTQLKSEDIAKFQQEALILKSLQHTHIINVLDFGMKGQTPYLVMDYAPNGTLRTRHSKGTRLPIPTVVDYVTKIAKALEHAHKHKVVHRDIKPKNILLDQRGEILLSDFGIALIVQNSQNQSTQDVMGSFAYTSPEQFQGKAEPASDQYSLGIVVYEWLSGKLPFQGSSYDELRTQHIFNSPPSLREEVSPAVERVVFRALEKQPENRFDSVNAFAEALEQASQVTEPTLKQASQVTEPTLKQSPSPKREHPLLSPLLSIFKLLSWISISLIVIIIFAYLLSSLSHSPISNYLPPFTLPKPLPTILPTPTPAPPFPALCSGNFQTANTPANTAIVATPPARTFPDGNSIGLSVRATTIFDLDRLNKQEVQKKLDATKYAIKDFQSAIPLLAEATHDDPTDAEAQIYLENMKILGSNHPHITLVVGVSFPSSYAEASRDALKGAFIAQKECNDHNKQDNSKTQIVLMIANVGGDGKGNINNASANFVADQIVDQAHKDQTIVGIMGWPLSAATSDVQERLKNQKSDLPMLAACSTSTYLGTSRFFRVCPTDAEQAKIAANFVLKTMKKERIVTLYQERSSWSQSLNDNFVNEISQAKGNIIGTEPYAPGDQDSIQRALNKVLNQQKKPDAIFYAGYPSDFVKLLKAISSTPDADLLIVGGSSLSITNVYPNPLPDLHNVYFTAFASPNQWDDINPKPPFFQDYKANFETLTAPNGLPSIDAGVMLGYDGMLTLLHSIGQVLSKKNTITPSDLEEELRKITSANPLQGVTGLIAFDSNGDQYPKKMVFVEHIVKNNDQTYDLKIEDTHGCLQKRTSVAHSRETFLSVDV